MKEHKILVWGTGQFAKQVMDNGVCGEIIGFVETQKSRESFMGHLVYGIDEIPRDYDIILVANRFVDEIHNICIDYNINFDKLIFLMKGRNIDFNQNLSLLRELLGEANYTNYLGEFNIIEESFFEEDVKRYNELNQRDSFRIKEEYMWPVIQDKYAAAGAMNNYFWQDLWAAQHIISENTKEHYDIGSRIDGFIAHLLAANIKVNMIDIRPFPGKVENLFTVVDDATMMRNIEDDSLYSLSALCSLEHFGLGRYGDEIDPEACFKCFEQITKKMKSGGKLYISVPIGKERVEFNAHRVFYASTIVEYFSRFTLVEFSCTAEGKIEYNIDMHRYDNDSHNGEYRYGLFHFIKK